VLAKKVSAVLHETQKERGASALFLGSKNQGFASALQKQRKSTDQRLLELKGFLQRFDLDNYDDDLRAPINQAMHDLDKLEQVRSQVDSRSLAVHPVLTYYTGICRNYLNSVAAMARQSGNAELLTQIFAIVNFMESKERAGIERAVLSNSFAQDAFGPGMYEKFVRLVAAQNAFNQVFVQYATEEQRRFYQQKMQQAAVVETERLRKVAFAKNRTGGFGIDAKHWFAEQTKKINLLKAVEDHMMQDLNVRSTEMHQQAKTELIVLLIFGVLGAGFVIVLTVFVIMGIVVPLRNVTGVARQLARGELDVDLDESSNSEIGQLVQSFRDMVSSQRSMAEIAEGIGKGDFSKQVHIRSHADVLGQAMLAMRESVQKLADEMNRLVDSAVAGQLSQRADEQAHQGEFRSVIQGVNRILDAIVVPLNETADYIVRISKGDIPAQISAQYHGDFNKLKEVKRWIFAECPGSTPMFSAGEFSVDRVLEWIIMRGSFFKCESLG